MPFNGNMLRLARRIRKVSQGEVVTKLSHLMTQGTLSKIEHGRIQPSSEIVEAMAEFLSFRVSFFYDDAYLAQPPVSYHRKKASLLVGDLAAIHGKSEVLRLSLAKCLDAIELETEGPRLPAIDLENFDGDAKAAALAVRQKLRIPRGPIASISKILEDSGVIVCPFNFGSDAIDGFCQHSFGALPSMVFLNNSLPVDRMRFSLAHECGHLVCHDLPNPRQEDEANQFASEFLMPSDDIYNDLRDLTLTKAMELKLYWGVSMQSLVMKAWSLGKIGDQRKKSLFIEMSRRGWRKREPVEARGFLEKPALLEKIIGAHLDELGYSRDELSEMFGIEERELSNLFPLEVKKPKLRIVSSN